MSDLRVQIGPLALANPVLTASGTFGYGDETRAYIDVNRLGGIVTKSLSLRPRDGNPPVRIVETTGGMLNSIGLANIGVEAFLPASQVDVVPPTNLNIFVGNTYDFKVVKIHEDRRNIVLSRRELIEAERAERRSCGGPAACAPMAILARGIGAGSAAFRDATTASDSRRGALAGGRAADAADARHSPETR